MTGTPVEYAGLKTAISWLRKYGKEALEYGKRIATLEQRVSDLEAQRTDSAPAEHCRYCGERAVRLSDQSNYAKGTHPKRWTEETWTCGKCGKKDIRRIPI
jgi:hypothetical protein